MTIIVLYNFRYKKLSKLCIQLLRYKQPVPYLPVNASMDNTVENDRVKLSGGGNNLDPKITNIHRL